MDISHAVILGIVEGITEFLPVSSTGHLILASELLGLSSTEFLKSFNLIIQLGGILAVVVLYGRTLLRSAAVLKRVALACIPTGIVGFLLYDVVKTYLLGSSLVTLSMLFIGGVALILFEYWHREPDNALGDIAHMPYATSFTIGVFQSLAIIPGVSRAAATIVGGLLLGVSRATIVEFSFLLAVPTILAASALDIAETAYIFSRSEIVVLAVGFVTSFVVAMMAIKFLIAYVKNHTFIPFGIYRIVLAILYFFTVVR
jgi:undecaprenyl-diphosphatase